MCISIIWHSVGEPVERPSPSPCGATDGGLHHWAAPSDGAGVHGQRNTTPEAAWH